MKTLRCFFCLCLIHFSLIAQQNFDPGYIIRHDQDTLKGFIEVAMESDLTQTVKFKKDGNTEWNVFTPADLLGFGIGNNIYRSLRFLNTSGDTVMETAFVRQLVTGEYNLYYYMKPDRNFFLLQKDTTIYFLYDMVTRSTGELIQKGNYLNYLNLISAPCEKLVDSYQHVSYNDKDMTKFVLRVDNCISGTKATSYYQKPKTLVEPFVFIGGLPISGSSQLTANLNIRISLPRVDNHSSINIGINYSNSVHTLSERNVAYEIYDHITKDIVYSVPVTFQYNITTTRVQPYVYAGFSGAYLKESNNYEVIDPPPSPHFGLAVVAGIGIEARIISHLYIKADWRYELLMQNPAIGLSYRF